MSTPTTRPNILFIFTDQQHARMMSCAGNKFCRTPAMDGLASRGVRFERAYCTNPVCVPSRFSLLTGRLPSAIGLRGNHPETIKDVSAKIKKGGLGWLFRDAGYKALYGGKQHLPKLTAEDLGFEVFEEDERENLARSCSRILSKPMDDPFLMVASFINPHDICYMAIRDFAGSAEDSRLLNNGKTELKCLDQALRLPPDVTEEAFFRDHCPPLPENFEPQEDEPEAFGYFFQERPFKGQARERYTERDWRRHRWAYARLTELVDQQIGKVLSALEAGPHADNTLVVFTSDHGDMDGAHRLEHKTVFYEESANIPLIISCPGQKDGKRVDRRHIVSNGLDLLPTLCDFAEIPCPPDLKGRSLRSLLDESAHPTWRAAIPLENDIGRMVVTGRYKYCRYFEGKNAEQLYDLELDPGEMRNFRNDPDYAGVLADHRKIFKAHFGRG